MQCSARCMTASYLSRHQGNDPPNGMGNVVYGKRGRRKDGTPKGIPSFRDSSHNGESGQQIDFFHHGEGAERQISQIHEGDLDVLKLDSEGSGPIGAGLYGLICERSLLKRIFVLSREQALDKDLWQQAADFYRSNKRLWKNKLLLQQKFQRRIVEIVENPNTPHPLSQAITSDARNKFLVDGRDITKAVLLIDFPPEKRASDIPLEFLVEEDRRRFKSDEIKTGSLEKSVIWGAIQNAFHESIAKLRVFSHPDHSEFLSAFLSRKTIESAISNALKEVEREGRDEAGGTATRGYESIGWRIRRPVRPTRTTVAPCLTRLGALWWSVRNGIQTFPPPPHLTEEASSLTARRTLAC